MMADCSVTRSADFDQSSTDVNNGGSRAVYKAEMRRGHMVDLIRHSCEIEGIHSQDGYERFVDMNEQCAHGCR